MYIDEYLELATHCQSFTMKFPIFVTLILMAAADAKYQAGHDIAEQLEELYESHKQECIRVSGVSKDDVQEAFIQGHYPNSKELQCYLKCVGIKLNLIAKGATDNDINLQNARVTVKAADLDILEQSNKFVDDVKDPCDKFHLYLAAAKSKAAAGHPPLK